MSAVESGNPSLRRVPRLIALAHGRSGDKGDRVNIGVIARREEWYEVLRRELSAERVERWLEPLGTGLVERYELPNLGALNFVVRGALGGGGSMNLKLDAQGKTFAQALLRMPLDPDGVGEDGQDGVPDGVMDAVRAHWGGEIPGEYMAEAPAARGPSDERRGDG